MLGWACLLESKCLTGDPGETPFCKVPLSPQSEQLFRMVYSINGFETKVASSITSQLEWTALSNVFGDTGSTAELSWPLTVLGEEDCQVCIYTFGSLYVVCLIHRFINTNSSRCCLCIQFLPFLLSSKGKRANDGLVWYSLPNPSMSTLKCLPGG